MKKRLVICLCVSISLLGFVSPTWSSESAVITRSKGSAVIIRADGPHAANVGMPCQPGDQLEVPQDSELDIALNGKVGCRLLSGTTGYLIQVKESEMKIVLDRGNMILNLDELPIQARFAMHTPLAVAAVRGTQFWGRVLRQDPQTGVLTATLAVREGSILITTKGKGMGQIFVLEAGSAVDLIQDQIPKIRPATQAELNVIQLAEQIKTSL